MPQTELNFGLSPSVKWHQNLCSSPPPVQQDLSTHHDWPVKNAIVDLSIWLKGNLKSISGNLLSLLAAQNKDISAASETLLMGYRFHLCMIQVTVVKMFFSGISKSFCVTSQIRSDCIFCF